MSNPAQIHIADEGVYFYAHLNGHKIYERIATALQKGAGRKHQPDYMARTIFDELTPTKPGVTGFGISGTRYSGVYRSVTIDFEDETVSIDTIYDDDPDEGAYSLSEFIETFAIGEIPTP